jgi:bla regulator protein blaR1
MKLTPAAVLAVVVVAHVAAQTPSPTSAAPAFEVASIKPNKGDGGTESGVQPGGRLTMTNVTLRLLIRSAYQVQDEQIVDAPSWISSEHFDVIAKAPSDVPPPTPGNPGPIGTMMRSLLAERFKLAVHRETRESPAYALELARRDGKLGPQLQRSTTDCAAIAAARGRSGGAPQSANERPLCGFRAAGGQMLAGGQPMSQLTTILSQIVQRVVLDKTGLSGKFDFELKWTPDRMPQSQAGGASVPASDPDSPSIFTALREELGLKLESVKNAVEVLVIDHVERPSPD